jgi:hypothetical protein
VSKYEITFARSARKELEALDERTINRMMSRPIVEQEATLPIS